MYFDTEQKILKSEIFERVCKKSYKRSQTNTFSQCFVNYTIPAHDELDQRCCTRKNVSIDNELVLTFTLFTCPPQGLLEPALFRMSFFITPFSNFF